MGRHVRMVCPAGTSVGAQLKDYYHQASNLPDEWFRSETVLQALKVDFDPEKKQNRDNALNLIRKAGSVELTFEDRPGNAELNSFFFPTAELQTILRWLAGSMKDASKKVESLHVVLLPSKSTPEPDTAQKPTGSELTAHCTSAYLKLLAPSLFNTAVTCDRAIDIRPQDIRADTHDNFLNSIANLFDELDRQRKHAEEEDQELVICSSGGYKAVAGFAMLYAQLHSLPCLYTFESSLEAYEVMSLPLGYAYAQLDEEINMLKAVEAGKVSVRDNLSLPRWVRDSEKMAKVLVSSYEDTRKRPFGIGQELFERLEQCGDEGKAWAGYLEDLLIQKWTYLWQGDQIPETVEHSRRHSKRLMEFTANLFRCAEPALEDLGLAKNNPGLLALLIASIYLHDIGHTALSWPVLMERSNTVDFLPLGLFPSAVREVHHLLTGKLLQVAPDRYFKRTGRQDGDAERAEFLAAFVPLVAAHHRGYTTLTAGTARPKNHVRRVGELLFGREDFEETLRPLAERCATACQKFHLDSKHVAALTALLRVIDGCDVQTDRVISGDYLTYRNQRSDDEARMLDAELLSVEDNLSLDLAVQLDKLRKKLDDEADGKAVVAVCTNIYAQIFRELQTLKDTFGLWRTVQKKALPHFTALSLANRVAFKSEQYLHFRKHRSVSFVLPEMRNDSRTVVMKVFGENPENLTAILGDIRGEYEKAKDSFLQKLSFDAQAVKMEKPGQM